MNLSMEEMDQVVQKCIAEEYQMTLLVFPTHSEPIHLSLEKGSTYGKMHMKFSAEGVDLLQTFNKCLANFPSNPVGALWDTKRISPPDVKVEDGEFTEIPQPHKPLTPIPDDEIPF